jgi:hypothetical protein
LPHGAHRLPEVRDVQGQVAFFDEGVRPEALHQLRLVDDNLARLDESHERLEDLGRQFDDRIAPEQETPPRVKPERTERADVKVLVHRRLSLDPSTSGKDVYASLMVAFETFDHFKDTFNHPLALLEIVETKPMATNMVTIDAGTMART